MGEHLVVFGKIGRSVGALARKHLESCALGRVSKKILNSLFEYEICALLSK